MMKKALIPVLAIAAASVAVPAAAQNYDRHDRHDRYEQNRGGWQSISNRKHQLDRRIERGMRNGALSRREGRRLENALHQLVRLERNYMRGGLTRWERNDLDRRYDRLAVEVRMERRDRDNRRG